jgi:hypothetical protein
MSEHDEEALSAELPDAALEVEASKCWEPLHFAQD